MAEKTLKLADGRKVPMEDGKAWPAEGASVEVTLYIRRRLADGDLVEVEPQATAPAEADSPSLDPEDEPETPQITGRKGRNGGK